VLDLAPREPESGCFADMTRTFIVGGVDDEIAAYQRLVREALKRAVEAIGVDHRRWHELLTDFSYELTP
jgi:Xaa-Pro aminopeptidase